MGWSDMVLTLQVVLLFCPSLLALVVWLVLALKKTAIPQRKPFYFGMALHGLSVLLAVGSVELMTYLAKDCTGCYSGIQLIILVPLLWLLFIVGAVLNVVGLRTPRAGHTTKLRKR
ncbi:hypothetical protein LVJ82_07300 [Vitreoscilla massiliensis]|uniref:Transmembrane protein n=1 Tax=Vitreoscilla massiliensis TaxID=1689272 RepID=A0ABY4E7A2_9NEIS|nr:hypothetical protein [Vitreoscilla massiliensis]UOO90765.1 hypothetical protein LVJ82_07300 [Vitreoscilla massiliensis]